ncbi:MAG: hypothetical protein JST89_04755 [Cyanobacteria bacterium SZAS-4]|nr:hypothetical protein [Cyanobacteria bacterium SZAS-4]
MKIKIGKKEFGIIPAPAFPYFLYSIVGVFLFCYLLDQFVLTALEDNGKICSASWRLDNAMLLEQMKRRNFSSEEQPIWRSEGFPVSLKSPKSKRILVMGDSFVWGSGYSNLNTLWWRQLQRELQRRGYNDVEVIAAGQPGAPTRKELNWAKKLVPMYKPDLVIWGYVTNDPEEGDTKNGLSYVKNVHCPPDDFPVRAVIFVSSLFPNLGDELFNVLRKGIRTKKMSGDLYGYDFADWELKLLEGKNWQVYNDTVKDLGAYVNQLSVPSFAMTLPSCVFTGNTSKGKDLIAFIRSYYDVRYKPVRELWEKDKIRWCSSLDAFLNAAQQDKRIESPDPPLWLGINPANGHPGPLATHCHAVETANILERDYPQVLGKRTMPVDIVTTPVINDWLPFNISLKQSASKVFFVYPSNDAEMLTMPIRKPFVQLNFANPVSISQLSLTGANLKSADIYISSDDPDKHFDDGSLLELGEKKGGFEKWNPTLSPRTAMVNTIRITAKFGGPDHRVLLDLGTESPKP